MSTRDVTPKQTDPSPFLRNQWYVIGWARDIGPEPYARTVCGEPILVYRKQDGTLAAMRDACPHRLLPLSMGIKEGDNIRCRYHGLLLDADGCAVEMPLRSDRVNRSLCAQKYPVIERYSFVWVWIGDADKADPALMPNYWMCEGDDWVFDGGTYHVNCHYELLVDNLMDLTHEAYVHSTTIGQSELMDVPITTKVDGNTVVVERWMADVPAPPAYRQPHLTGNVDRWQICYFLPPSGVVIDVGVAPVEEKATLEDHPVRSFVINAMTPETETTTYYYWGAARNVDIDDEERTRRTREVQRMVFGEDIEILEAQQRSIALNPDLKLLSFNIDSGGARARMMIRRMLREQADALGDRANTRETDPV
ncbi:MAG TPA: aromatic ring-hydroxylating dioxygenase subunit alpha [Sphingobium sp.]|nr:aromatic ring-hydroxylating dioxygenase subunit alpha [Sphingobium sp.]